MASNLSIGNLAVGGSSTSPTNSTGAPEVILEGTAPLIAFRDESGGTDDYVVMNADGAFQIKNDTDNSTPLVISNAGNVTLPAQPAFNVNLSTAQNDIAKDGWITVLFDTERFDQGSNFNTGTYTFTAPVAGRYQLGVSLRLENVDTAANYYQVEVITSNKSYRHTVDLGGLGSDPTYWSPNISILADMDASDTAYVNVYQHLGTAQTDINAIESTFSGYLAC